MLAKVVQPSPTLSVRLLWPFARLIGAHPSTAALLRTMRLSSHDLALDQRVHSDVAFEALRQATEAFGDPTLGLRVGSFTDQGTFGVLERAAATADNLGAALEVMSRHLRVMNEAAELRLHVTGAIATLHYVPLVAHPPAANDLAVMSTIAFIRRHCAVPVPIREVWLVHPRPLYADSYAHHIDARVCFDMRSNALVFDATSLAFPMRSANADMAQAFDERAVRLAQGLVERSTVAHRLRERLSAQLEGGDLRMNGAARALRMSVATLRRKLEEEGTSFSGTLDEIRQEGARRLLTTSPATVTEVARLLGFSHVRAFTRAFQRWTGKSPSEFRKRDEA